MLKFLKLFSSSYLVRRSSKALSCFRGYNRSFADTAHTDLTSNNKQYVIQGSEKEQRLRVRRARSSDVPRVLRFVREQSRAAWPGLVCAPLAPTAASQLVLADYVSRALAQGHSMVAEQVSSRRGWLSVRGLALAAAVCPWDAHVLERWARCMRDARSRRFVAFTAHCLRAPALHDKYRVHNILQVILLLAPEAQNNPEIVHVLAKSAIQRGREVGFPLLRFDVTNTEVAKALEEMKLKKEWQLSYDVLPETMLDLGDHKVDNQIILPAGENKGHFIAVYTARTKETEDKKEDTPKTALTSNSTPPSPKTTNPFQTPHASCLNSAAAAATSPSVTQNTIQNPTDNPTPPTNTSPELSTIPNSNVNPNQNPNVATIPYNPFSPYRPSLPEETENEPTNPIFNPNSIPNTQNPDYTLNPKPAPIFNPDSSDPMYPTQIPIFTSDPSSSPKFTSHPIPPMGPHPTVPPTTTPPTNPTSKTPPTQ